MLPRVPGPSLLGGTVTPDSSLHADLAVLPILCKGTLAFLRLVLMAQPFLAARFSFVVLAFARHVFSLASTFLARSF